VKAAYPLYRTTSVKSRENLGQRRIFSLLSGGLVRQGAFFSAK
jgi:hypothetical protein